MHGDFTGLVELAIAGAGGAAKVRRGRLAGDPARRFRFQPVRVEPVILAALGHVQHIAGDILAHHEPGLATGAMAPADAQAVALAQRVIHRTLVLADQFPLGRAHLAGAGRDVLRQEAAEIAFADETDAGGILLGMRGQRRFAGQFANTRFLDAAQRKQRGGQLLLAQRVQEIALILGRIHGAQQPVTTVAPIHACVVAGGDFLRAQRLRLVQKRLELDLPVAQHVGVGGAAGAVFIEEMGEHAIPVLRREIARVERNAQPPAYRHRVLAVGIGGAWPAALVFLPVLHEQALDLVAGLLQKQGGDRGIDATGNAQHHFHAGVSGGLPGR